MIYWSHLNYRRRTIRFYELVFWVLAWATFATVVVFPQSTTVFLEKLRINRTMDLLMIVGFMLVWVLVFANYLENRRLRKKLQELVRELALRDGENP
jgi:hypothetical protein